MYTSSLTLSARRREARVYQIFINERDAAKTVSVDAGDDDDDDGVG